MSELNFDKLAGNAANFENVFNSKFGYELGDGDYILGKPVKIHGAEYEVLADYNFNRNGIDFYQKAVVLQNKETGEIYFHFNGTGDGNWVYNAAVYGAKPQPSVLQKECLLWFDMTMEKLKANGTINENSSVYVTGHSQGGNNAMFVTMRSKYSNDIDACIPLDGPGFSNKFVDDTLVMLGENEYDSRRNKIWAYIGENDYVAFLGQQSILPDKKGYPKFVKCSASKFNFMTYHASTGLLVDKDGKIVTVAHDSQFRRLLKDLVDQIPKLPQDEQATVAITIMAILENYMPGDGEFRTSDILSEDFRRTLEILTPILAEFLKEHPDEIGELIANVLHFDSDTAETVTGIIRQYGNLEQADREAFLSAIFDLVKVEDNKITLDITKLAESYDVISEVVEKMVFSNPDTIRDFLKKHGINSAPVQQAAVFLLLAAWKGIDAGLDAAVKIIDTAITAYEALKDIGEKAAGVLVNMFESVKIFINSIKTKWREKTNKGIAYVQGNPYFKADTDKLREYSARLERVNNRLSKLDSNMRSLYWQVGLLDLWDILLANMITSKSYAINQAKKYLYNTADRFENAENKAKNYIGG